MYYGSSQASSDTDFIAFMMILIIAGLFILGLVFGSVYARNHSVSHERLIEAGLGYWTIDSSGNSEFKLLDLKEIE